MSYQLFGFVRTNSPQRRSNTELFSQRILALVLNLAIAFYILTPMTSAETNAAFVSGRVLDQNGSVVGGATITLRQKAGGFERVTVSNDAGHFRFNGMIEGDYHLSVSRAGFSTFTQELKLSAGESRDVEVTLKPGTISEKVTVTATRTETVETDTAVPVSIIERKQIERQTLTTIGDLFRQMPGVSTVNEGPFQVRPRIRGLDSNRVLILVDGERLNNSRTSTSNSGIETGLVDVDQIESVEVARGSGSVLYGTDALGGTINIITRDTLPREADGFGFGGGFNGLFSSNETGRRGSAYVSGTGSRFAFRVAHTQDRFDNYHSGPVRTASGEDDGDEATEVPNSQYHGSSTHLIGRLFINDFHSIRTSYERRRASNIGVAGVTGVFTAFFPFSNRDKVSARYEGYNQTPYLTRISASIYHQSQERNFSNTINVPAAPPAFPGTFQFSETITDIDTVGFDMQSNWALGSKNVLTAGASYFRDHNGDTRFIEMLSPDFRTFPPSLVRSEDRSKSVPDSTFGDLAFFAQDEFQPVGWLRLIGGLRVDRFDINSERTPGFDLPSFLTPSQIEDLNLRGLDDGLNIEGTAVSGDISVVVKPVEKVSLTARMGRSFRQPNLFERFFTDFGSASGFVVGNPDLEPETGVNFDAGIKLRTARFAGSFAYFNNAYEDFLTSTPAIERNGAPITIPTGPGRPPIPVFRTINTGRARIQGLEADFEAPLSVYRSFLSLFGNISYLRGDDLDRDVPLNFITPLKTVIGLRWQDARDRLWSEYSARIINGQERLSPDFLIANGGAEPGFATHDVRGGVNFRHENYTLGFTVALTNLANRFYNEQFVFAPARGRSASVGVNLRFN